MDIAKIWPLLVGGGAVIAGCFNQIRSLLAQMRGLVLVKVRLSQTAGDALVQALWADSRRVGMGDRHYTIVPTYVRKLHKSNWVLYETASKQAMLFLIGKRSPLWVSLGKSDHNEPYCYTVTFVRGTVDIEALLARVASVYRDAIGVTKDHGRFCINRMTGSVGRRSSSGNPGMASTGDQVKPHSSYSGMRPVGYSWDELGENGNNCFSLSRLALSRECLDVIEDVRRWRASESWYDSKGIQWRYGIGLYGPPGTAKTSLARALAKELDFPLYVFDLATMDNIDMGLAWQRMLADAPCAVLLEDFDTVFVGREPANPKIELTFECVLNCLSGVQSASGVLTFLTTNAIDKIDPALGVPGTGGSSSRPGRIDALVRMDALDEQGRRKIAGAILSDATDLIEPTVVAGAGETGAQFEDRCRKLALQRFWEKNQKSGLATAARTA